MLKRQHRQCPVIGTVDDSQSHLGILGLGTECGWRDAQDGMPDTACPRYDGEHDDDVEYDRPSTPLSLLFTEDDGTATWRPSTKIRRQFTRLFRTRSISSISPLGDTLPLPSPGTTPPASPGPLPSRLDRAYASPATPSPSQTPAVPPNSPAAASPYSSRSAPAATNSTLGLPIPIPVRPRGSSTGPNQQVQPNPRTASRAHRTPPGRISAPSPSAPPVTSPIPPASHTSHADLLDPTFGTTGTTPLSQWAPKRPVSRPITAPASSLPKAHPFHPANCLPRPEKNPGAGKVPSTRDPSTTSAATTHLSTSGKELKLAVWV